MLPIPLILGSIAGLLSLFAAAKNASDAAGRGRGRGMQGGIGQQGGMGQMGLPKGALQIPKFNPQQMQGLSQLLNQGFQGLQQTPFDFGKIKDDAYKSFYTDLIPTIQERYAGTSSNSSGLQGAIGGAGARLERELAALQQGYNVQNRGQALQALSLGLQSPYETIYKKRQPGFGENAAIAAIPAAIQNAPELTKMFSEWFSGAPTTGAK